MLLGNVVAITLATIFNNLDSKRQYPTSWGHLFGFCTDLLCEEYQDSEDERLEPVSRLYIKATSTPSKPISKTEPDAVPSDGSKSQPPVESQSKKAGGDSNDGTKAATKKRISLARLRRHTPSFLRGASNDESESDNSDEIITA
jgi:hypothetical protein